MNESSLLGRAATPEGNQETVIAAGTSSLHYWREIWRFRGLLALLVWRDLLVRYKQTVLGVAWALIRPVVTMVVFTLVFGKLANLPSGGAPYPLLVFAAMLPWQFFASTFADAGNSLVGNASMIAKVYFPRLIIPAGAVFVGLVDLVLAGFVFAALCFFYGYYPGWALLCLPIFVLLLCLFVGACGLIVAALNVEYRDFRYVVPFVIQLGTYISPVGFSSDVVPERWRLLYALNPMVGIIDGFRWCLLPDSPLWWPSIGISALVTVGLAIVGYHFFRKVERHFADVI